MAEPQRVIVIDVHMSFGSMVTFIVKWTIASIPALVIFFVLGVVTWGFLAALVGQR
jgi:hypothetical protein